MVAVFAARDVFLFYVLFEAMLIPVYFLIGVFGGAQRRYAAVKFLVFSLAGGLIMLVAVIALYLQGPGGPQGVPHRDADRAGHAAWSPSGCCSSRSSSPSRSRRRCGRCTPGCPTPRRTRPPGTSTLLVGVLDKVGTFGMLTLCLPLFPDASRWAAPVIIALAVISVLYGALLAIGQQDLMRLIAYTSVSHFGFIVLGIFAFTSVSVQGSALYMVNHGLSTGALFLIAGFLVARRRGQPAHRRLRRPAEGHPGARRDVPRGGPVGAVAAGPVDVRQRVPRADRHLRPLRPGGRCVAVLGVVLAALYVLLTYQRIFTGPVRSELATTPDLSARERWAVGPLIALMVLFGFYPAPMVDLRA